MVDGATHVLIRLNVGDINVSLSDYGLHKSRNGFEVVVLTGLDTDTDIVTDAIL